MASWGFLGLAITAALAWLVLAPLLGVASGTVMTLLFTVAILALLKYFNVGFVSAFPVKRKPSLYIGLFLIFIVGLYSGWFSMINLTPGTLGLGSIFGLPSGEVTHAAPSEPSTPTPATGCVVSQELLGKSSTIDINAWDQESNTPYSSAVDGTCWVFINGVFQSKITDTSAASISAAVGDKVTIYCGGTSYYGDKIEKCITSQRFPFNIDLHAIQSESNLQTTVYDDTGSTALSAGTSNQDDYYMTMGAGETKTIYVKLKNNGADKAYDHAAFAVAKFYNITDVKPVDSHYTKVSTPLFAQSVAIKVNESSGTTITRDYTIYKRDSTERLHEWESLKVQFEVKSDATNNPNGGTGTSNLNGFAICSLDATWARGTDGNMYYDIYDHSSSENNVGLSETLTSPLGKQDCVLVEVR